MSGSPSTPGPVAAGIGGISKLAVYIVSVWLFSGAVSGGLYLLLVSWGIEALGFGELCFRIMQFGAIAGCIPLLAWVGHRGWSAWGLGRSPRFLPGIGRGVVLGIVSLSIICAMLLILDLRVIRPNLITDPRHWVEVVIRAALASIVIAIVEEAWFRGALHTIFSSVLSVSGAVFVTAAFYALSHFLRPDAGLDEQSVQLWSGFTAIFIGLSQFPLEGMEDSLAALFIAGVLLGMLRARHGNIAVCIGVHAGWVFVIKVHKKFTFINPPAELNMLVGQYDGVLGWLAAGVLLLLTLLVWRFTGLSGYRNP